MRYRILIAIMTGLGCNVLFAQKTKIITKYFTDSKEPYEIITVLADKPNIKHGFYISYYHNPKEYNNTCNSGSWIRKQGFYNFDNKDSVWIEYKDPIKYGNVIDKEEHYKDGKKIGIWLTWIDYNAYSRFDYDKNRALFPQIHKNDIVYPIKASEKGINGKVDLKIIYNEDYTIKSMICLTTVDSILIKEVIREAKRKSDILKKYAINIKDSVIKEEIISYNFVLK